MTLCGEAIATVLSHILPDKWNVKMTVIGDCPYLVESPSSFAAAPAVVIAVVRDAEVPAQVVVPAPLEEVAPVAVPEIIISRDDALRKEATSIKHLMTHMPKNPFCESCQRAKCQAKASPNRKKKPSDLPTPIPTKFGEQVTGDTIIHNSVEDRGVDGSRATIVLFDRGTKWIEAYPVGDKSAYEAENAMLDFATAKEVRR